MHCVHVRAAEPIDQGAGTALVVGLVAAVAICGLTVLGGAQALVRAQLVTAAADAAALAAGDVLLGWAPGDPCAAAERVAVAHGVRLSACAAEGMSMLVHVELGVLGITVSRAARAGSPDWLE